MKAIRQISLTLAALGAILALPYLGAKIKYGGHLPDNFFKYPPIVKPEVAGFNPYVFGGIAVIFIAVALLYIFPGLYGFKKTTPPPKPQTPKVKFPFWFWLGLVMWGVPIALLWSGAEGPKLLLYYSDLPIFWGFTFILDGIVYKLRGGSSIINDNPKEMIGIGSASVSGWMLFELLNFFIKMNWYYPLGNQIHDNYFLMYALVGSSGLLPMAFEWYDLLRTFPKIKHRFDGGKKIVIPAWSSWVLLAVSLVGMFFMGLYPEQLFWSLWVWPLLILSIVVAKMKIYSPFTPVKDGNWSPLLLFALAYLLQGVAMEGWNYFSGTHSNGEVIKTLSPAYWVYNVPYVHRYRIFEMPLLGYVGYLPFSVYCWIYWIVYAYLQGIDTKYYKHLQPE
jgi:hypothetical protein